MARIIRTKRKVEEQKEEEVETPMSEKKKQKRQQRKAKERNEKQERTVRESGCCMQDRGVLIRWKEVVSWRWMHEEETDRGRRRAAEFTPCLEKAPSCLVPFLLSSLSFPPFPFRSFFRIHSPISFHLVRVPSPRLADSSSILRHLFFLSTSPSSCLPASLTPRGHSGHCTRSYLPAAFRPLPPSKVKVFSTGNQGE